MILFLIAVPRFDAQQQPPPRAEQHPAATAPKQPPPADERETSFEEMLGADRYLLYGEVRNVGQQMSAPDISNLIGSIQKLDLLPNEAKPLLAFVTSHAEALASARLILATMRSEDESKLPQIILAVEFTSAPEAQKFEPQLQKFLRAAALALAAPARENRPAAAPSSAPSFALQRKANVILLADAAFETKNLKTPEGRALAEEPHFQTIKARLTNEPVFIYVNTGEMTRRWRKQMQQMQERSRELEAEAAKSPEPDAANENSLPPSVAAADPGARIDEENLTLEATVQPAPEVGETAVPPEDAEQQQQQPPSVQPNEQNAEGATAGTGGEAMMLLPMLLGNVFGGGGGPAFSQWPEGAGVGVAFESDSLVIRSLMTTEAGEKINPIPMLSFFRSGPATALEAPALMPENAELMVSASLDLPRMFDSFLQMTSGAGVMATHTGGDGAGGPAGAESQIAALESKYGFSIRNELLPAIGNEIAVSVPMKEWFGSARGAAAAEGEKQDAAPGFLLFISLRDKAAAQDLLPRVLEAFGIKAANQILAKEMRGDVEVLNSPVATLAFIKDFLVIGQTAPDVYRAVDAYNQHQTLAGSGKYAEAVGWQPAQKLAQFYLSERMMKDLVAQTKRALDRADDRTRNAFADFNPPPKPITFAVSADGAGVLHELHLPKSLITTLIAAAAADSNKLPFAKNEDEVAGTMQSLYYQQMRYYSEGKQTYATLDQLNKLEGAFPASYWDKIGYRLEVNAMGDKFEATATPREYGTTGKMSYFIDETGVLRGADNGGSRATAADKVVARY